MKQTIKIFGVPFDLIIVPAREARERIGEVIGVERFDKLFELPFETGAIKEENGDVIRSYSDGVTIETPAGQPTIRHHGTGFFGIAVCTLPAARKQNFLIRAWAETGAKAFDLLQLATEREMGVKGF